MTRNTFVCLALLLTACGGEEFGGPALPATSGPIQEILGMTVVSPPDGFTRRPDFQARFIEAVSHVSKLSGHPIGELAGATVIFQRTAIDCPPNKNVAGCAWTDARVIVLRDDAPGPLCLETTAFTHEILHLFLVDGDPGHSSPLWSRLYPIDRDLMSSHMNEEECPR